MRKNLQRTAQPRLRESRSRKKSERLIIKPVHIAVFTAAAVLLFAVLSAHNISRPLSVKSEASGKAPLEFNVSSSKKINVLCGNEIKEMPLEEYLIGVVSAEMPSDYSPEALKAQAVAARTYTLRKAARGGCSRNKGADICTDSGHCQAYADSEKLKARWGADYESNLEKITSAVASTAGEILVYNGEAIEALFCASAGGMTENSENVYSEARDYLKSVKSPDTEGYIFEKSFTFTEFASRVKQKLDASVSASKLSESLEILSRYESGRVEKMRVGNKTVSGGKIRSALGLSSTNFIYSLSSESITFTSFGYGHGIGMSQSGANAFAGQGMTYDEILLYYYKGVSLENI